MGKPRFGAFFRSVSRIPDGVELVRQTNVLDWCGFRKGWGLTGIIGGRGESDDRCKGDGGSEFLRFAAGRQTKKSGQCAGPAEFLPFVDADNSVCGN